MSVPIKCSGAGTDFNPESFFLLTEYCHGLPESISAIPVPPSQQETSPLSGSINQSVYITDDEFEMVKKKTRLIFTSIAEFISTSIVSDTDGLPKMIKLYREILPVGRLRNAEIAMKVSNFEKGMWEIRDYYSRIIASTKTIVKYCSNGNVIPHIITLIQKKSYQEAEKEIQSFLHCLKKLIKAVQSDIEAMLTSARSEVLQSLSADSFSESLRSFVEAANLSSELRNIAESNIVQACRPLSKFFNHLNLLQSAVNENTVDELKLDMVDLLDSYSAADGWMYKQKVLQLMYQNFTHLSSHMNKSSEEFDKGGINECGNHSVEFGTPV